MNQKNKYRYGQIMRDGNNKSLGRMSDKEYNDLSSKHGKRTRYGKVVEMDKSGRMSEADYKEMQSGEDVIKNILKYWRANNG